MDQYIPNEFPFHTGFIPALDRLERLLEERAAREFRYILPSQATAKHAQLAIKADYERGADTIGLGLSRGQFKSSIYDMARGSQQLQAYEATTSVVLLEHIKAIRASYEQRKISALLSHMRGVIERAGFLVGNLKRLQSSLADRDDEMLAVLQSGEIILRCIYSTRVDWEKVVKSIDSGKLSTLKKNEIEYIKKDDTADQSAQSILNSVDKLDAKVKGTRILYEVYCEFLHPNFGDIVGSTVKGESFSQGEDKVRFMSRHLGSGPADLSKQVDISYVLDATLGVMADIFDHIQVELNALTEMTARVRGIVETAQHKVLRRQAHLFSRGDLCPCLSGKTIRHCAPRAWRGK